MANRKESPPESGNSRVTTRSTNANKHPGTEAVDALRVKIRRDPKVVQAEKEKKQAAKEVKEKDQQAEMAKRKAAEKDLEDFRAQQATNIKDDATARHQTKAPSNKANASNAGPSESIPQLEAEKTASHYKKRVSSVTNDSDGAVAKKAKIDSEVNRPRPRPLKKKKANAAVSESGKVPDKGNSRKCSSPGHTGDEDGNATDLASATPVRPVKRVKGDTSQPLRHTETFIMATGATGSGIAVVNSAEKVQMGHSDNATPRQQKVQALDSDSDEEIEFTETYKTPLALRKKKPAPAVNESEAELSELEQRGKGKKGDKGKGRKQETTGSQSATRAQKSTRVTSRPTGSVNKDAPASNASFQEQGPASEANRPVTTKKDARVTSRPTGSKNKDAPTSKASSKKQEASQPAAEKGASKASSQASSASRTTASHQISAKTDVVTLKKSKAKGQNLKKQLPENGSDYNASDEDDSLERKEALASPVKGIAARKANKTQVKVEKSKKVSLSKEDEAKLSNIILPFWLAAFSAGDNAWKTPDDKERSSLINFCERVFDEEYACKLDFADGSELWKKAKEALSQYRSRMKLQAFQVVQEDFETQHPGDLGLPSSAKKRMEYGKEMMSEDGWRFLCSEPDDDVSTPIFSKQVTQKQGQFELYQNPLIIKTFSVHFYLTTPKQKIKNYELLDPPKAGVALAIQAVEHALKLYRDDRLEFKKGSLSVKKTETAVDTGEDGKTTQKQKRSTKFDFSGTNYEVQTLGYLAGIEEECKLDPNLFKKICEKAKKANGARKPAGGDHEVEDKFASIRSDPAFLARTSLRAKMSGRVIFKTENGENSNGKLYKIDNADEAPANSQDKSDLVEVGENALAGCEAEDEPEVGENAGCEAAEDEPEVGENKGCETEDEPEVGDGGEPDSEAVAGGSEVSDELTAVLEEEEEEIEYTSIEEGN